MWARPKLPIIDDVGLGQLKKRRRADRRHSLPASSTGATGAPPQPSPRTFELSEWGHYLGDAIITRAILDRIVMNAVRLRIDGPSYRQQVAQDRANKRAARRSNTKTKPSTSSPSTATTKKKAAAKR
ncbi:MAG: ATP-binding protein [Polyangiaceae bacterium]